MANAVKKFFSRYLQRTKTRMKRRSGGSMSIQTAPDSKSSGGKIAAPKAKGLGGKGGKGGR